ncbi:P-II family nitrogen regulator [Chrysiogenes arsenatis]|uniref:P-II family nitrogen regulator n=1 Tax=Chrysiogenes arsenatis TaxID=309797 RepID=UPI000414ACF0|nr:P-II family nitrogen regulator [Chrysiogenes arsenatis]
MITHKLLVTIVKKGAASTIVKATKAAGAEGGTILPGKGTGITPKSFFGFCVEPEKEIIFTLIPDDKLDGMLEAVARAGKLTEQGNGIAFALNINQVIGIAHLQQVCSIRGNEGEDMDKIQHELIITVVNKGNSEVVVDATKRAGAEGGTIIYGRGTGIHEQGKLFSIAIEPEKELVLTLIDRRRVDDVLAAIEEDTRLNEPGNGIAFVLPVEKTIGIKRYEQPHSTLHEPGLNQGSE